MRRIAQILILAFLAIMIIPIFLPDRINAEVSRKIDMPPGVVFEEFNNLNRFSKWEPWASADSLAGQEFFSPYRGKGAGYKWTLGEQSGILTITSVEKDKKIKYNMEGYGLGKDSEMTVEFTAADPNGTELKWAVNSKKIGYFSRYYSYFTSDRLKQEMNLGLDRLQETLKSSAMTEEQAEALQPGMIATEQFEGMKLISVLNETTLETSEIITATEESLGLIRSYLVDFLKMPEKEIGLPVSYFEYVNTAAGETKFHTGYQIKGSVKPGEGMELASVPASETLVCIHSGSYSEIPKTIDRMKAYAGAKGLKLENYFWEEFQNSSLNLKNRDELMTKICIPIRK